MCDINKITKRKKVTIYKVAIETVNNGIYEYYSYFAGTKIKIGKCEPQTRDDVYRFVSCNNYLSKSCAGSLFNSVMVGKTSGFASIKYARALKASSMYPSHLAILKIVLSGVIATGTTARIGYGIPIDGITFAGSYIESFEIVE